MNLTKYDERVQLQRFSGWMHYHKKYLIGKKQACSLKLICCDEILFGSGGGVNYTSSDKDRPKVLETSFCLTVNGKIKKNLYCKLNVKKDHLVFEIQMKYKKIWKN